MASTKGRIEREGRVSFGDASLHITEEGISDAREKDGPRGALEWERQFKKQVFLRIVQQLNRIGWTCIVPPDYIKQYGLSFAQSRRECSKGDLKGFLDVSGRCIKFEMWQGVNTPTRSDHGGRYEDNKESVAPYLLRLEMYRTRNRIRDYLCSVFTGYTFNDKDYSRAHRRSKKTAMEQIQQQYAESWHFKGDWAGYVEKNSHPSTVGCFNHNRKSADGTLLEHGQRVWFFDYKGRIKTGIAYYNINNMWWVVLNKHDYTNESSFGLYTSMPENPRVKRNDRLRRGRIEGELAKAVGAMKFERAAILRDLIFPKDEQLFVVWHTGHNVYHCSGFCGYTANINKAGKFTAAEVKGWDDEPNEVRPLQTA